MTLKKLSNQEKEEIRVLYRRGGISYDKLADDYGTSKSTVKRIIKADREGTTHKAEVLPPRTQKVQVISTDQPEPIDFLLQKLNSLQVSIDQSNEMGVMGALAGLHKLHKETYNEYQAELKKQQGTKSIENPEELVEVFMRNYQMLPVYLKDIIKTRIEEEG